MNDQQFGYWRFPLRELFVLTTVMSIVFTVAAIDLFWGVFFGGLFVPAFYRGRADVRESRREFHNNATPVDFVAAIAFAMFIEFVTLVMTCQFSLITLTAASFLMWFKFYRVSFVFDWWWAVFIFIHAVITWVGWPKRT